MTTTLYLNYVKIALVVSLYWVVSILTVFVNKTLLSNKSVDVDIPFFIVWFQCFIGICICAFVKLASRITNSFSFPEGSFMLKDSVFKVFPVTVVFVSMVVFNTLCLKYADISFYYIGRSLTTVFNVACTRFILREHVSVQVLVCCLVVTSGFMMGIDQESISGTLSVAGTLAGVLASFSVALYSICTKKVLPSIGNHIWLLSYYNNIYSCFILAPIVLFSGEMSVILNSEKIGEIAFWWLMVVGGICGFLIGYVTSLQIKTTSALTHTISGTVKACAQTVLASFYYSESRSLLWWISNFIVLIGSAAYTMIKQKEMKLKFMEQKPSLL
ncbi:GDP-fucose transporter 1 [Cimex lectularius]|uniref:Sugar phosphate transporter domain-containing protein n=1 Tax=Cimex lectularius TaxID=79782 RepID=A0A8I6RJ22_CIMLE|nr:GDP-fucose transporter 1 [Cimex lectularius]